MKNRFHQHAKAKPRKDSLVDFIRRFSDVDKQAFQSSSMKDSYATDANAMSTISSKEKASRTNISFSARNAASSIPCLVELSLIAPTLRFSRSLLLSISFSQATED